MNAAELISATRALGVELYPKSASTLCAYPAEVLPTELRASLQASRVEVLAILAGEPYDEAGALRRACARVGADFGEIVGSLLPADRMDLAVHRYPAPELDAFVRAVDARLSRLVGRAPATWTQPATCAHCGPVLLWVGSPATLDACPWCWSRRDGLPIPRPAGMAGALPPPILGNP